MTDKGESLVLIGVAENEMEANIWRDILKNDGIGSFVKGNNPLSALGAMPGMASFEVFVQASDEQRARWLLGDQDTSED
jgi:hypothetical protein